MVTTAALSCSETITASGLRFADDPEGVIDFVERNGFHIEKGYWSAEECADFSVAADRFPEALGGGYGITQAPHALDTVFQAAAKSPGLIAMMQTLLKGRVMGLQSQWFYAPSGYEGYGLHQDNHFIRAKPDCFGTLWHAVDQSTAETGGLVLLPGSHLEGILDVDPPERPDTPDGADPYVFRQNCVVDVDKYRVCRVEAEAGSVIFLHANLIHASLPNMSRDSFRRSFVVTYLRDGASFRVGAGNKRVPFDVSAV